MPRRTGQKLRAKIAPIDEAGGLGEPGEAVFGGTIGERAQVGSLFDETAIEEVGGNGRVMEIKAEDRAIVATPAELANPFRVAAAGHFRCKNRQAQINQFIASQA